MSPGTTSWQEIKSLKGVSYKENEKSKSNKGESWEQICQEFEMLLFCFQIQGPEIEKLWKISFVDNPL